MGRIVIACYKPNPGKEASLRELMQEHMPILRSQELVTERESVLMVAAEGTIIEVFEWRSHEAVESAHTNPVIQEMWERYAEVCDYVPVTTVAEAAQLFSEFDPL
jgi:quinol monooxygenase YgiN